MCIITVSVVLAGPNSNSFTTANIVLCGIHQNVKMLYYMTIFPALITIYFPP